jgi:hypothetical protein
VRAKLPPVISPYPSRQAVDFGPLKQAVTSKKQYNKISGQIKTTEDYRQLNSSTTNFRVVLENLSILADEASESNEKHCKPRS